MKQIRIVDIVIALASAGWLIPLLFACETYALYLDDAIRQGHGCPPFNSFPMLSAAASAVELAMAWLGLVIAGWTYWLLGRSRIGTRPNNSSKPTPLRGAA